MLFVCYGQVATEFKDIAQLKKLLTKVKRGELVQHRLDCYKIPELPVIGKKFESLKIDAPTESEIFYPSENYPPHRDDGGTSYFIPLESGVFQIEGVNHPVLPFLLYSFEDSKMHNTDFCAIMLK